jgi:hypothetical protein
VAARLKTILKIGIHGIPSRDGCIPRFIRFEFSIKAKFCEQPKVKVGFTIVHLVIMARAITVWR